MNYYSFHIGDYATQTRHLSLLEDLAYRRLLDLYYDAEAPIPLDVEKVAKRIGMRDHIREVSEILSDFFVKSDDGYRNVRADREIAAYKAKAERARGANASRWKGQKSDALLKSDAKSDTKSDASRIPTNNQEPRTNNQEPVEKHTPGKPAVFDAYAYLEQRGIHKQLIADWLKLRRGKQAAVTETALIRIEAQAELAKMPLAEALAMCCERGWAGFKAEWVTKNQGGVPSGKQAARDAYFAARKKGGDDYAATERDITGEATVIA